MKLISAILVHGSTGKAGDITMGMDFVFEDEEGHRWKTDTMPCFRFEMEYVPKD